MLLIIASASAQTFIGTAINLNSAEVQAGYAVKDIEITLAYKTPFCRTDIANTLSITVGKKLWVMGSNYSINPSIGLARYRVKDFCHHDIAGDEISISSPSPILRVELGKNYKEGLFFISFNYCRNLSMVVGMKCYFKK